MYGVTFKTFLRLGYFILDQKLEAKREREKRTEGIVYSLHICKAFVSSALWRQSRDSHKKVGLTVHIVHSKVEYLLNPLCFIEKQVR